MKKLLFAGFTLLIIIGIFFGISNSFFSLAKNDIYISIPKCVQMILSRQGWLKPEVFSKTEVSPSTGFALLLSSKTFAGTETVGITLPNLRGATIYISKPQYFDPFTIDGVSYWAHELKHVQQILNLGSYEFIQLYLSDYLSKGGYVHVSLEAEASKFEEEVHKHLTKESLYNDGVSWCQNDHNYTPNPDWKEIPLITPIPSD